MKYFRHIALFAILAFFVSTTVFFVSCKNKCGTTTCQNGGTCESNACVCPKGYSGNSCGSAWSDKYVGTYTCTTGGCTPANPGAGTWTSSITKSSTDGGFTVVISNFASSNTSVAATVDTLGKLNILLPSTGYGISGDGTLSNTTILMNYTLSTSAGGTPYHCSFTMVKQ